MKSSSLQVSGDNPVFVESVKPGGAAQIAGLVAGDMILKVRCLLFSLEFNFNYLFTLLICFYFFSFIFIFFHLFLFFFYFFLFFFYFFFYFFFAYFLQVNGKEVRSEKHPTVVSLIKGKIQITIHNRIIIKIQTKENVRN